MVLTLGAKQKQSEDTMKRTHDWGKPETSVWFSSFKTEDSGTLVLGHFLSIKAAKSDIIDSNYSNANGPS